MDINNIPKLDSESDKVYQERLEFIKKVVDDKVELKEAIRLSKIWVNFIYNNCRYSPEVFGTLKRYLK